MIKSKSCEKALHKWNPWVKAIKGAHSQFEVLGKDTISWWNYAGQALKGLKVTSKPLLRLYFLSCVFSEYEEGEQFFFERIHLPEFLYDVYLSEVNTWARCLSERYVRHFLGIKTPKHFPDLDGLKQRPLPPAIWTRRDVELVAEREMSYSWGGMKVNQKIRECYGPFFIVLAPDHPLSAIGRGIKRSRNAEIVLACARMKDEGYTYVQIGQRFGWKIQKNSYGKPSRCITAMRYVKMSIT